MSNNAAPSWSRLRHTRATLLALALLPAALSNSSCEQPPAGGVEIAEAESPGLRRSNGLSTLVRVQTSASLSGNQDLASSSAIMNSADGRNSLGYLVKCALPEGRSLVKTDRAGNRFTFAGSIGFAPEWENNRCEQGCQEWVSACMLSLMNTTGVHVPVWMMATHSNVGFGQNNEYPRQEGSFFGNIFDDDDNDAFFCAGRDYKVGPVAGRVGSPTASSAYTNIYGDGGQCSRRCTPADGPYAADGFKACSGWNRVVTIWRK